MIHDELSCHLSGAEKKLHKTSFMTTDEKPMFVKGVCQIKACMSWRREKSLAPLGIRTRDSGEVING